MVNLSERKNIRLRLLPQQLQTVLQSFKDFYVVWLIQNGNGREPPIFPQVM